MGAGSRNVINPVSEYHAFHVSKIPEMGLLLQVNPMRIGAPETLAKACPLSDVRPAPIDEAAFAILGTAPDTAALPIAGATGSPLTPLAVL